MRARATGSASADAWRGARIGAEARSRGRRRAARIEAEVDLGEPRTPRVTVAFLAAALLATVAEFAAVGTSPGASELARVGGAGIGALATGAWWKLLAANLLHANLAHVAMNAFVVFLTGRWLEHLVGPVLVATTIAWSALLASAGALLVGTAAVTVGASGVAFGLVGCAVAVDPRARTPVGVIARQLALVNVLLTFLIPGISIGGHLGGLVAGLVVGWLGWSRRTSAERPAGRARRWSARAMLVLALPPVAVLAAGPASLPGDAAEVRGALVAPLLERQLRGARLSDGRTLEQARCTPTRDPRAYECTVDGDAARVRFSRRDDQWSLRRSE